MHQSSTNSTAAGCFSQIGLLAVVAFGTLSILALTVILPPWVKVDCQRRQILYWSEQVKVHKRTFAGYDLLFADPKWQRIGPANPASDTYFDVTEYQVFWPLLVGEWIVVLMGGGVLFFVVSRRLRRSFEPSGTTDVEQNVAPNSGDI
jgi:hypothetical protein